MKSRKAEFKYQRGRLLKELALLERVVIEKN
jgi:hypothetical protein